jgi:hypothetical protein
MGTVDEFVPDPIVAKEFNVTLMTLWRWDHSPEKAGLGWPPAVRLGTAKNTRKFRSRKQLEQFKTNLLKAAFESRGH